jgi:hypothetical protein
MATMVAALLVVAAGAGAQTLGYGPAVKPLIAKLRATYPGSTSRFANCPGNNTIPQENGGDGHACEFRVATPKGIFKGSALMVRRHGHWSLDGKLYAIGPISRSWQRCGLHKLSPGGQHPDRLAVKGVTCGEARYLAYMIGERAQNGVGLRLPAHFTEGENGTDTLGFIVGRYKCDGRLRVKPGTEDPYGHETATCRTRFGDRFTYVFDQFS